MQTQLSDQSSGYQFPASKKFVKKQMDEDMCYHLPVFSARPWLHGFLPDYKLDTWQGHLRLGYLFKERDSFYWIHNPDGDEVKPGRSRSSRRRRNSF